MASSNNRSELETVLGNTEIGTFILKHLTLLTTALVVICLVLMGWGGFYYYSSSKNAEINKLVFEFEAGDFKQFSEDKIKVDAVMAGFETLKAKAATYKGFLPFTLELSDTLFKKGHLEESRKVLNFARDQFSSENDYTRYFIFTRLAAVNEDLKQYDDAISSLEKLASGTSKLLEARTYFDLGRLYLKVGNKEKSKVNFNYVIDNFAESELSKMAKAYLFNNNLKD